MYGLLKSNFIIFRSLHSMENDETILFLFGCEVVHRSFILNVIEHWMYHTTKLYSNSLLELKNEKILLRFNWNKKSNYKIQPDYFVCKFPYIKQENNWIFKASYCKFINNERFYCATSIVKTVNICCRICLYTLFEIGFP